MTFIEARALTGPGYHAVQMFEKMVDQIGARAHLRLLGYAQESARHHFSVRAQRLMRFLPDCSGRVRRVLYEQFKLPLITRRDKVALLLSPSFVSPMWGAPKLAAIVFDMYYKALPEAVGKFQGKYWRVMIPMTARVCRLLLTISENSKRDMINYLGVPAERVVVTPCGSRMGQQSPRAASSGIDGPFVLVVANLTPNKNVAVVVDGVARARAAGMPYKLVHVGSDPVGQLAAAVERFDATDFVVSTGKIDNERLVTLYQDAFALVVASLYEGFCMPIVEAQSVGGVVIAANTSCLPEVAGDAALYFNPHRPDQLANQIVELHADPALRHALVEAGRVNAKAMTWDRTSELTLDALEQALER